MQHLSTSHGTFLPIALRTCWNLLLDALMWPRMIDVRGVLLQHPLQMPLMHAQHVVETFLTHGSHPALRNGMCRWCPDGRADDRHVVSREHLVKGRWKRGIRSGIRTWIGTCRAYVFHPGCSFTPPVGTASVFGADVALQ